MENTKNSFEHERQLLAEADSAGGWKKYRTFLKLSGPGWIASAITLGGGSLASSLYLGVLGGYSLLWLQPLAMILGVIMLSAIGYVTLSTGERPFPAINQHVSPVLGWGWALAVAASNVIWCMPQHSLAYGVLSQNLLPKDFLGKNSNLVDWAVSQFGDTSPWLNWLAQNFDKLAVSFVILLLTAVITWGYDRGGWGLRLYEITLKIVVAMIVLCFFGVVVKLSFSAEPLEWGKIVAGFVPDFGQIFRPATSFQSYLDAIGEPGAMAREFWSEKIVYQQRDVMISAAATAVGINMTLMFPYTMLRRGWTKEFRGLSIFDLCTGMFIPFVLATSFVVIASAASFHTELPAGFSVSDADNPQATVEVDQSNPKVAEFNRQLQQRNEALADETGIAPPTANAEARLAAMLVKRDAIDLSKSLEPLTGEFVANLIFGLGVLAMVLSTISILMLISGFVYAEMLGYPPGGKVHKLGTLVAGVGGALWPLFWAGESKFFLAVVTSVFGFMLLPFAYVTFVFLMNSNSLLGEEMPRGGRRFVWNVLMMIAAAIATIAATYMIWVKVRWIGVVALALFVKLALLVWINGRRRSRTPIES